MVGGHLTMTDFVEQAGICFSLRRWFRQRGGSNFEEEKKEDDDGSAGRRRWFCRRFLAAAVCGRTAAAHKVFSSSDLGSLTTGGWEVFWDWWRRITLYRYIHGVASRHKKWSDLGHPCALRAFFSNSWCWFHFMYRCWCCTRCGATTCLCAILKTVLFRLLIFCVLRPQHRVKWHYPLQQDKCITSLRKTAPPEASASINQLPQVLYFEAFLPKWNEVVQRIGTFKFLLPQNFTFGLPWECCCLFIWRWASFTTVV